MFSAGIQLISGAGSGSRAASACRVESSRAVVGDTLTLKRVIYGAAEVEAICIFETIRCW
jgi:hypothetical protein